MRISDSLHWADHTEPFRSKKQQDTIVKLMAFDPDKKQHYVVWNDKDQAPMIDERAWKRAHATDPATVRWAQTIGSKLLAYLPTCHRPSVWHDYAGKHVAGGVNKDTGGWVRICNKAWGKPGEFVGRPRCKTKKTNGRAVSSCCRARLYFL